MLELGAKLNLTPTAAVDFYGKTLTKPLPCKVIYINQRHGFFTVEFAFPNGNKYKESFKLEEI